MGQSPGCIQATPWYSRLPALSQTHPLSCVLAPLLPERSEQRIWSQKPKVSSFLPSRSGLGLVFAELSSPLRPHGQLGLHPQEAAGHPSPPL